MIKFITEEVRSEFHKLSIDKQREWTAFAEEQLKAGWRVLIDWVDVGEGGADSEVCFRVDKEFDPSNAS